MSVGILASKSPINELITAAVQRRIYTELSPLPLVADPHLNRIDFGTLPHSLPFR